MPPPEDQLPDAWMPPTFFAFWSSPEANSDRSALDNGLVRRYRAVGSVAMAAISSDLEQFVEQEVASGRYADRDAVIAHGLALLRRDREEAVAGIAAGF